MEGVGRKRLGDVRHPCRSPFRFPPFIHEALNRSDDVMSSVSSDLIHCIELLFMKKRGIELADSMAIVVIDVT
jgi:hypothetical protein